ncbi:hypothetical protein D3C76_1310050 [compost metagenome]
MKSCSSLCIAKSPPFLACSLFHEKTNCLAENLHTNPVHSPVEKLLRPGSTSVATGFTEGRSSPEHPILSQATSRFRPSNRGKTRHYPQSRWSVLWTSCTDRARGQDCRGLPDFDHFSSYFNSLCRNTRTGCGFRQSWGACLYWKHPSARRCTWRTTRWNPFERSPWSATATVARPA